jgi:hypothetical protein
MSSNENNLKKNNNSNTNNPNNPNNLNNNNLNNNNSDNNIDNNNNKENMKNNKNNKNSTNNTMSTQNRIKKQENEAYEAFIEKSTAYLQSMTSAYRGIKHTINGTPLIIKIMNTVIPFCFTYYFTVMQFNLAVSVISALVTFIIIFLLSKVMAIVFLVLYISIANQAVNNFNKYIGTPIKETDIAIKKKAYDCLSNYLVVDSKKLLKDVTGGYFSYSFWIYVNGNDNSYNKDRNWYAYRYNEWKSIFYRGTEIDASGNMSTLIQYPGFWLTPNLNNMVIVFQNTGYIERIEVTNIPFNKWTNYVVVVESKSVSLYIDGLFDRAINLYQSIVPMSGYNLYIANDKNASKNNKLYGFAGYLAQVTYYNFALKPSDVNSNYNYYSSILDNFQSSLDTKEKYVLPQLITNSDFYLEK